MEFGHVVAVESEVGPVSGGTDRFAGEPEPFGGRSERRLREIVGEAVHQRHRRLHRLAAGQRPLAAIGLPVERLVAKLLAEAELGRPGDDHIAEREALEHRAGRTDRQDQ